MTPTAHWTRSARRLLTATILLMGGMATPSLARAQAGHGSLNTNDNGVILHGYDAVAYQVEQRAVKGSASYTATHDGAIYQFVSAGNRDAFKASPAKYAPAYGGYCAMGVAVGKKLDGDPAAFTMINGRLFLNVNDKVRGMWAKDVAGNEVKAQKKWPEVRTHSGFDAM
jgi:YHS domain-containing protein